MDKLLERLRAMAAQPANLGGYVLTMTPAEAKHALDEIEANKIALADAIRRPMGVIPDSAEGLVTTAELDAAEVRRMEKAS